MLSIKQWNNKTSYIKLVSLYSTIEEDFVKCSCFWSFWATCTLKSLTDSAPQTAYNQWIPQNAYRILQWHEGIIVSYGPKELPQRHSGTSTCLVTHSFAMTSSGVVCVKLVQCRNTSPNKRNHIKQFACLMKDDVAQVVRTMRHAELLPYGRNSWQRRVRLDYQIHVTSCLVWSVQNKRLSVSPLLLFPKIIMSNMNIIWTGIYIERLSGTNFLFLSVHYYSSLRDNQL